METTIEKLAKRGEQCDVMKALTLLTQAYIDMCGVSLGFRTVVYCAGESWLERLAWKDLPLSEMARKEAFVRLMPHITTEYEPNVFDKYDISGMDYEELQNTCYQMVRSQEFDEPTLEVLCWGILKATEKKKWLAQEVEVTAPDESLLKGILTQQKCSGTWMTMTSPYNNLRIVKFELVRNPEELLISAYNDYQRLHQMEGEIRALYPLYREKLKECGDSAWKKHRVFRDTYGEIIRDIVLAFPQKLFKEWFGLQFTD